jgi:hypothetical protein
MNGLFAPLIRPIEQPPPQPPASLAPRPKISEASRTSDGRRQKEANARPVARSRSGDQRRI